ncbi:MAG: biotin--[acetyl-CoA-carboxylase] ligase [Chloroflexi bacterium]|nr:biotin--[acetyl-CoA-carboxylase] ligase [Chloroflexota bacterium]
MTLSSELKPDAIKHGLATSIIGREIIHLSSTTSTNDVAKALASEGAADGTVVLAEEQTAGRGRLGRQWLSPPGTSILCSVVLRPHLASEQAFYLTIICSLAIAHAIEDSTGLHPYLKWPNDILINDRKVVGVLTELELVERKLAWAVVGFGLNVNFNPQDLPDLGQEASSLSLELGRPVPRSQLLQLILRELDCRYAGLADRGLLAIFEEWKRHLGTLGRQVCVTSPEGTIQGLASTVDIDGALIVRRSDGQMQRVLVGDVSLRPTDRP